MAHVAILVNSFPPGRVGGVPLQAEALARHLSVHHRVVVLTRSDPFNLPSPEVRNGYTILRSLPAASNVVARPQPLVPKQLKGRGLASPLRRLKSGFQLLADTRAVTASVTAMNPQPDVLLCLMTLPLGLPAVRSGQRLGIPAIVWIRGEWEYRLVDLGVQRRSAIQAWERAATVLVTSEISRTDLLAELAEHSPNSVAVVRDKLIVVENGVELPELGAFRPNGPVVSAGRLVAEKRMDVVVAACAHLGRPLIIAGDGPEMPVLRAQAAALGADVRFTGYLDRAEMNDLYRQASVVVLASAAEGLSNVVIEAMAHARPVVATRVGGIPGYLEDGVTGLLIPPDDPPALTAALASLSADPEFAKRLGMAARETALRFTWQHVIPRLEEVLQRNQLRHE